MAELVDGDGEAPTPPDPMHVPTRPGKQVQLAENEIRCICLMAKEICMSQPALLELEAPIKVCGKSAASRLVAAHVWPWRDPKPSNDALLQGWRVAPRRSVGR